jgi:hypothetical protein
MKLRAVLVGILFAASLFAFGQSVPDGPQIAANVPHNGQECGTNHNRQPPPTDWMLCLTAALVFVASVQAIIYGIQACLMRSAIIASKESSERQLRAYVSVSYPQGWDEEFPKNIRGAPSYTAKIKNTGQTPAYNVISRGGISSMDDPQPDNYPPVIIDKSANIGRIVLAPEEMSEVICELGDHTRITESSKSRMLYVRGRIEYDDAFGRPHFTDFCFIWVAFGGKKILRASKYGNDAD